MRTEINGLVTQKRWFQRPEWLGRGLTAMAVVAAAGVGGTAFRHWVDVRYRDGIVVSGVAIRRIRSNRAIWSATVVARAPTLAEAYATLNRDVPRVRQFLLDRRLGPNDIHVLSVSTTEVFGRNAQGMEQRERIIGYELSQAVEVVSGDVDRVSRVARDVTQLIEAGVYVQSTAPEYIYANLGSVKVRLVGDATADARARAEQVAHRSGGQLGPLISASVGVVQVNAANQSSESYASYDRTSIDKDVMLVVRTMFLLE